MKPSELPQSYEEFAQRKEWAGKVAIDGTDNEWLKAIVQYYGERDGIDLVKRIVATLRPVVTDGHLAMARATGAGEYWVSLNNYVNLSMNVKLAGGSIDVWALDPVTLFFGQVGVNAKASIRTRRGLPPTSCSAGNASSSLPSSGGCRRARTCSRTRPASSRC